MSRITTKVKVSCMSCTKTREVEVEVKSDGSLDYGDIEREMGRTNWHSLDSSYGTDEDHYECSFCHIG